MNKESCLDFHSFVITINKAQIYKITEEDTWNPKCDNSFD